MDIDWLEAEIERLSKLPNAEVGVPMFLVPEDLSMSRPPADVPEGGTEISRAFDEAIALLQARRGTLTPRDIAAVIEVLAEHHLLGRPFSSIAAEPA
ncbi:hypothetical protein [Roseisalinus antarcticus]|uniref:Uncharacterized protein n=1 Tax=Roseisalinus antarcticus TaxID=254357 RepID=A0A1Y5TVM0_9RHOB|nr:hypothetical protein [Roseisalinus antarcticus]SLN74322.1 hypothetical protein ROA7023_03789 [Roseisalinus antarcticus]